MQAGSYYTVQIFINFLFSSSNKTVWTGLKIVGISSCILARCYAAKGVQFAWSVTRTVCITLHIYIFFFNFQFKQNCLNWLQSIAHIIVHISTMICSKCCAICMKCNTNQFALHLSKKAIYLLVIASKGCNYVCHAI